MAECFLTSLHAIGFKKDHPTTVEINKPELQKQDNAFVTFKNNAFYLSENIRSVFFNDYVALLNLNTMKCYWVYADESKWPETMKQQLIQAKVVIPRQN